MFLYNIICIFISGQRSPDLAGGAKIDNLTLENRFGQGSSPLA
jgi:hypothetical protein